MSRTIRALPTNRPNYYCGNMYKLWVRDPIRELEEEKHYHKSVSNESIHHCVYRNGQSRRQRIHGIAFDKKRIRREIRQEGRKFIQDFLEELFDNGE